MKLGDKLRALELLAKHLKLFAGRAEHELAETKGIFLELRKALGLDKLTTEQLTQTHDLVRKHLAERIERKEVFLPSATQHSKRRGDLKGLGPG